MTIRFTSANQNRASTPPAAQLLLPGFGEEARRMTPRLTVPNPGLGRQRAQTPKGMMHWAGTCSDPDAKCAGCRFYGYTKNDRNDAGIVIDTRNYRDGCVLYHNRVGRYEPFYSQTPACKYFEAKPS